MFDDFNKTITVKRYAAGTYTDGRWVDGSSSTFTIQGSTQPVNGKELLDLPEGERYSHATRIYTATMLNTVNETTGIKADRVIVGSQEYEVVSVETWNHVDTTEIDHYKIIVARRID